MLTGIDENPGKQQENKMIKSTVTKFAQVCIKNNGHISHRAKYLFETDKSIGRYYITTDYVTLHPWHVTSGRGFSTVVDNLEVVREILKSIKCSFVEGNDAPRGGQSGQFIRFDKRDFLNGLRDTFGAGKGRALYVELGLSSVLTAGGIETLKTVTPDAAAMLSPYYNDAWRVMNKQLNKDLSIAVFPDEE